MSAWWTQQDAGLIGGVFGSLIGLLGGGLGILGGCFARKGELKSTTFGLMYLMLVISIASLITGIVAVLMKQPYHVWYPLVLVGFIGTAVGGSMFPTMRNVYRQAENRRFEAEQLRRA